MKSPDRTKHNKFQFLLEKIPKDPETWTKHDVLEWLRTINMSQYCCTFEEVGVDGWVILELDDEDLVLDLKVNIKLHRKKILKGNFL